MNTPQSTPTPTPEIPAWATLPDGIQCMVHFRKDEHGSALPFNVLGADESGTNLILLTIPDYPKGMDDPWQDLGGWIRLTRGEFKRVTVEGALTWFCEMCAKAPPWSTYNVDRLFDMADVNRLRVLELN